MLVKSYSGGEGGAAEMDGGRLSVVSSDRSGRREGRRVGRRVFCGSPADAMVGSAALYERNAGK